MESYKQFILSNYPSCGPALATAGLDKLVSDRLVKVSKNVYTKAKAAIESLYFLSRQKSYRDFVAKQYPGMFTHSVSDDSVLMAYDFHTTAEGEAYLVEVNTNASGYLVTELLYHDHDSRNDDSISTLTDSFFSAAGTEFLDGPQYCAIVDENVREQKMYIEFLMYQDLMQSWGWKPRLCEARDLKFEGGRLKDDQGRELGFVYNRTTDFQFEHLPALREAYTSGGCPISPHPQDYLLLSHKQRLSELNSIELKTFGLSGEQSKAIKAILIPSFTVDQLGGVEAVWEKRKDLFIKPLSSHGGKAAFRGSSISRKTFDGVINSGVLIQKFTPAQSVGDDWKFDLRFYVFRDQIQMAAARLYQGQVTNFSTAGGGLSRVEFV